MDVRHVGVRVLERRVDVGMRVRLLRRHAVAVRVPVMLVVDVHVIVLETLVDVRVQVPLAERSEEHTSELQSRGHLVCRLLLEKKKKTQLNAIENYTEKND